MRNNSRDTAPPFLYSISNHIHTRSKHPVAWDTMTTACHNPLNTLDSQLIVAMYCRWLMAHPRRMDIQLTQKHSGKRLFSSAVLGELRKASSFYPQDKGQLLWWFHIFPKMPAQVAKAVLPASWRVCRFSVFFIPAAARPLYFILLRVMKSFLLRLRQIIFRYVRANADRGTIALAGMDMSSSLSLDSSHLSTNES